MFDNPRDFMVALTFFGPIFLFALAWLWTIVVAFAHKDFGMAILSILLAPWMLVYQVMHPVRCRIPIGTLVLAGLLLAVGWNIGPKT